MLFPAVRSFGAKLTLLVTLTTGFAVLVVCSILALIDYVDTARESAVLAASQTSIIAVNSEAPLAFGDPQLGTEALAALKAAPTVAAAHLYTADGKPFAYYVNPAVKAPSFTLLEPGRRVSGGWLIVTNDIAGPGGRLGRLQVVFDRSYARSRAWYNGAIVFGAAVLTTLVAFLTASRIKRFLVQPIDELASTAKRVSATKDYTVRAQKYGDDELGQFTDVFNEMLAQIQQQNAQIRQSQEQREAVLEAERMARLELERADRLKDEFVATLSHELRTPLTAILGWAQVLRAGRSETDVRKGVEIIERNARAQTQIIEDLLDVSRIVAGKVRLDVQNVNLPEVIDAALATVRPAAEAKGIRLHTVLDRRITSVRGDPNRLQQVVWNLLSNAIKFTDRGGRVEVALARVNSHVEVTVTDTGQGIAPEFLPHAFERFRQSDSSSTRRHGGLGLGLSIVKQLVELHGGTVRVSSQGQGKGTTFSIELPLMPVTEDAATTERVHPREPRSESSAFEPLSLSGVKVLVVDDERDALELITRLLEDHGAKTTSATSAAEALDVFKVSRPDVLISDIGMPIEDGYELMQKIRAMERSSGISVPAVALTAFARSEDRTRAMLAGYQMHLAKPVEVAELIAAVASLAGLTVKRLEAT